MMGMRRFKERTEQVVQPFCTQNSITPIQLRLLMQLHYDGPQTVSNLAKKTCMAGANSSALCKRLAQKGLVLRQRDPADERQVMISLSPEGQRLMDSFAEHYNQVFCGMAAQCTPEDIALILAGLDRLLTIVEEKKESVI